MNWEIHNENGCMLGLQGSGKTLLVKKFLNKIPNTPRIIISPQNPTTHYGQYGEPISELKDIQNKKALLWVGEFSKPMHAKICNTVMQRCRNTLMIVDDAHEFATKQKISDEWATLINSGRNIGNTSLFVSPAPNLLNNILLQSSTFMCCFRFKLESQIEYAKKNFYGDAAYLLMPEQARPGPLQHLPRIEKHDFLYCNANADDLEWHKTDGSITTFRDISELNETHQQEEKEPENEDGPEKKDEIQDNTKPDQQIPQEDKKEEDD